MPFYCHLMQKTYRRFLFSYTHYMVFAIFDSRSNIQGTKRKRKNPEKRYYQRQFLIIVASKGLRYFDGVTCLPVSSLLVAILTETNKVNTAWKYKVLKSYVCLRTSLATNYTKKKQNSTEVEIHQRKRHDSNIPLEIAYNIKKLNKIKLCIRW